MLKKLLIALLVTILMFSLVGCKSSEPTENDLGNEDVENLEGESEEDEDETADEVGGGLHVNVFIENGTSAEMVHIPIFRFELYDDYREGTLLTYVDVDESQYRDGIYRVVLDIPEFELGQKFHLLFRSSEEQIVEMAVLNDANYMESGGYTTLKDNQFATIEIVPVTLHTGEEVLSGAREFPYTAYLEVNEKLVFVLEDSTGSPIEGEEIKITWESNGSTATAVSDKSGVVVFDIVEKGGKFTVEATGSNYKITERATSKLPSLEGFGVKTMADYTVRENILKIELGEPAFPVTDTELGYWGFLSYIIVLENN